MQTNDNQPGWKTNVESVPEVIKNDLDSFVPTRQSGDLLYLDEIDPGQEIVLQKFIGIRLIPFYGNHFYCFDYLDEEYEYKRIAFQAESTVGKQLEDMNNKIINNISEYCHPDAKEETPKDNSVSIVGWDEASEETKETSDNVEVLYEEWDEEKERQEFKDLVDSCEYTEVRIKRWEGTSIYYILYKDDKNENMELSLVGYLIGDCKSKSSQTRENVIVKEILKDNDATKIKIKAKKDVLFVERDNSLISIIGKGDDNSVSLTEREEIWHQYSQIKYSFVQKEEKDHDGKKVVDYLVHLFHRSTKTLLDIIEERKYAHDADLEGSTDLSDYIFNIIQADYFNRANNHEDYYFVCNVHLFGDGYTGDCMSFSYSKEEAAWTYSSVDLSDLYDLSEFHLPLEKKDLCEKDEIPEVLSNYIENALKGSPMETYEYFWFHPIGRKRNLTFSAFILIVSNKKNVVDSFKANPTRLYDYIVYLQGVNQIEKDKQINKKSSELAAAAIMSRNMSHNLGSHVMSYIKQSLSSVENMFHDNVLTQLIKNETDGKQSMPFLLGLAHFFSYLQERQDFIATIATDYIPTYSTVNFKDHIYDELNPDKRYQRHSERKDLEIDNILLGNIAQSEGLGRPISPTKNTSLADIVLKFRDFNGGTPVFSSPAEKSLEEMRGYDLSIPGGVVGRQAIFSIVENVIRNAAKHGNWRDAGKLELTFDIYDLHDIDSGRISADDNVDDKSFSLQEVLKKYYFSAKDKYDNYVITLTDNLSVSKESLGNLRKALSEEYIDPLTGTMNNGNKGLKEMRISSAWLRAIDEGNSEFTLSYLSERNEFLNDEGFQNDKNWYYKEDEARHKLAPLIYTRISKSDEGTQRLQYIFCVRIPKKVAVLSDKFNAKFENEAESKLLEYGWRIYSPESFLDKNTDKSFEFIILDDIRYDENKKIVKDEDLYNQIRKKTSSRLIGLSELPTLTGLIDQIEKGALDYDAAYQTFSEHIAGYQENDIIAIQDSKTTAKHKGILPSIANPSGGSYLSAADGKVSISDGVRVESYIYRTHHNSKSEFVNFMANSTQGGAFQDVIYVEGISGDNSTDRFVRNEKINDIWFYKHLHAMKTKVAIFDERIFSKVFGLKESDFYREIVATADNINEVKKNLEQEYPDDLVAYAFIDSPDELNQYLASKNLSSECDSETDNYIAKIFEQKNIFVYNLIRSKDNPFVYHLIGLKNFKKKDAGFVCCCGRIASFSWDIENKKLIVDSTAELRGQFDKISIHQGLLDKLYTAFGFRNHKNEADMKEQLTRDFYQFFSKSEGKDAIEFLHEDLRCRGWFLPGMAIHSGRSKPGEKDMPQLLPFIQYASIEHAVFDCKLSLVELLDFARYE